MSDQLRGKACLWRYTAETPKFFGVIDARALVPFVMLIFYAKWWVFYLALATTIGFVVLGMWRVSPWQGIRAFLLWVVTLGFRRTSIGHRMPRSALGRL